MLLAETLQAGFRADAQQSIPSRMCTGCERWAAPRMYFADNAEGDRSTRTRQRCRPLSVRFAVLIHWSSLRASGENAWARVALLFCSSIMAVAHLFCHGAPRTGLLSAMAPYGRQMICRVL